MASGSSFFNFGVLACMGIGLASTLSLASRALMSIYRNYLRGEIDFKKFGTWAVVTGATDGIGKAYCNELAKRGLKLFMISRTESKLKDCCKEISEKYGVETEYMAVDYSSVSKETWTKLRETLKAYDIALLVNNVGTSYEHYEYLHFVDDKTIDDLIEINVRATTEMTRAVLPGMVERKRGLVVSLGSGVGSVLPASPLLAAYAGTKAYIEQLTKCLDVEYRKQGIRFQDQAPLFVATKMTKIRRAQLTIPSPNTWVAGAIKQIGYEPLTTGYSVHNIMWGILSSIPASSLQNFALKSAGKMRERALQKKQKQAGKKD
eukprot:evm.model.scf_3169.2 EVM.evm.TU.scf_3169.2   scf_3169:9246-13562(-)